MSPETDIAKIREEIKEMKRLHKILETYADDINRTVGEFNEARKKDIAKLAADLKVVSDAIKKRR